MDGSDTESEPEVTASCIECDGSRMTTDEELLSLEQAVELLKSINPGAVDEDNKLQNDILQACNTIIPFLDEVGMPSASPPAADVEHILSGIILLLDWDFLCLLFEYRLVFHALAIAAIVPGTTVSTIVCWVDVVLAKLSEAIVNVASGFMPVEPDIFRHQREDDNLRAAAQLPCKWDEVSITLKQTHVSSPAAKRLALRLSFGVFVLRPQFIALGKCVENQLINLETLGECIMHLPTDIPVTKNIYDRERISYAMTIALFSAAGSMKQRDDAPSFRPFQMKNLLHLIQHVMYAGNTLPTASPHTTLDAAQKILLRFGNTVPWAWTIRDDQKISHAECVISMTASWLYHFDSCVFSSFEPLSNWTDRMRESLLKSPLHAANALLTLCHSLITPSVWTSTTTKQLLPKLFWAITQVSQALVELSTSAASDASLGLCKCLCAFMVQLIGLEEVQPKDLVIEGLTGFNSGILKIAIKSATADQKVGFAVKLDLGIKTIMQDLNFGERPSELSPHVFFRLKYMLDVVTIVCYAEDTAHAAMFANFLSFVAQTILKRQNTPSQSPTTIVILESLLTALSSLERIFPTDAQVKGQRLQHELLWQLAVKHGAFNLSLACALASHTLSIKQLYEPLVCLEVWDHLRDVILLIFSRNLVADFRALSLLVYSTICTSLTRFLRDATPAMARVVVSSPWTKNLCELLQRLASDDNTLLALDPPNPILEKRLKSVGESLLRQISSRTNDNHAPKEVEGVFLAFCIVNSSSKLLLMYG